MARRHARQLAALALAVSTLALPAAAAEWVVELTNGTSFFSRYQPAAASWDADLVLFTTAEGNLVALYRDEIASVRADVETRGFGTLIDDKTISLGIAPNDLPDPSDAAAVTPELALLQEMVRAQQQQPQQDFSVQQFVDPSAAGLGGLPAVGGAVTGGAPVTTFGTGGNLGPPGLVTAPPAAVLPVPQATSLPAGGSSLPAQTAPATTPP
jgi:hypothetical protein